MKKSIFFSFFLLLTVSLRAQDITDALRYSSEDLAGTARFQAMSGAFGALGGDLSAMDVNPAGAAVFLNSYTTVSLNRLSYDNDASFLGRQNSFKDSEFNLSQAGAVLVFNAEKENNNWKKFTLGINYSQRGSYDDFYRVSGSNAQSIADYFLNYANGTPLDLLETRNNESVADLYTYLGENEGFGTQQALLGYQGFIVDPVSTNANNTQYTSSISPGSFNKDYSLASSGINSNISFNFATQFKEVLYLGANLNAHVLNYDRTTRYYETNSNNGSTTNEVRFENSLSTDGNGFSFQLGAIAKVTDMLRIGAAYESPTWYNIEEQTSQYLETYSNSLDDRVVVAPNVLNVYPDYTLKTPGKITGSLAVLFGNQGLLSFDYSYKDYSNMEFRPDNDPEFQFQNNLISNNFKAASSYRVGGEYRIQKLSLRAGYRFEESPYQNTSIRGDLSGYSGGLGYDFGSIKIDLSYSASNYDDVAPLYQTGLDQNITIERDFSSAVLSVSFGI